MSFLSVFSFFQNLTHKGRYIGEPEFSDRPDPVNRTRQEPSDKTAWQPWFLKEISSTNVCMYLASKFECFPCCASLSSRLSDTSSTAVSNLDAVLSSLTVSFDECRFTTLIEAYNLLNRQPGHIMEKVIEYSERNIRSSIRKIVGVEGDPSADALSIDEVCARQIKGATELCNILTLFSSIVWQILSSYSQIQSWYRKSESAIRDLAFAKLNSAKSNMWDMVQVTHHSL